MTEQTLHERYLAAATACWEERAVITAAYERLAALVKERDKLGVQMRRIEAQELRELAKVAG